MSATFRTIELPRDASDAPLAKALGLLLNHGVAVRLGESLQLTHAAGVLQCDVIDDASAIHRCAFEYEVMVENARHALEASTLGPHLSRVPRHWRVVVLQGEQQLPVWPLPAAE